MTMNRTTLRVFVVPVLLVTVATIHYGRTAFHDQSSWGAGCGFGMFAKVDYHGSRYFRCFLKTDNGEVAVELPSRFGREHLRTRVSPTNGNLRRLAESVVGSRWIEPTSSGDQPIGLGRLEVEKEGVRFFDGDVMPVNSKRVRVHGVRLELWIIEFDQQGKQINTEKLGSVVLDRMEPLK